MINPLLKHPILSGLPYDQLTSPTKEGIIIYLNKRRRNMTIVSIFFFLIAVGELSMEEKLDFIAFIYPSILFLMSVGVYYKFVRVKVTDEEINVELKKFADYTNGKHA